MSLFKSAGTVCNGIERSETNKTYYGITLNLSPYRKVDERKWNLYKYDEQCQILLNIFSNEQMDIIGEVTEDYVFEKTEKGNAHIHAMLWCTLDEVKLMQRAINEKHKYPRDRIDQVFHYSATIVHRCFWDKYMQKDQPKKCLTDYDDEGSIIPRYNMFCHNPDHKHLI